MPVSDLDIFRSANLHLDQHGDQAVAKAREMVRTMKRCGVGGGARGVPIAQLVRDSAPGLGPCSVAIAEIGHPSRLIAVAPIASIIPSIVARVAEVIPSIVIVVVIIVVVVIVVVFMEFAFLDLFIVAAVTGPVVIPVASMSLGTVALSESLGGAARRR